MARISYFYMKWMNYADDFKVIESLTFLCFTVVMNSNCPICMFSNAYESSVNRLFNATYFESNSYILTLKARIMYKKRMSYLDYERSLWY